MLAKTSTGNQLSQFRTSCVVIGMAGHETNFATALHAPCPCVKYAVPSVLCSLTNSSRLAHVRKHPCRVGSQYHDALPKHSTYYRMSSLVHHIVFLLLGMLGGVIALLPSTTVVGIFPMPFPSSSEFPTFSLQVRFSCQSLFSTCLHTDWNLMAISQLKILQVEWWSIKYMHT